MRNILFDATGIVSFTTGLGKYSYYLLNALLSECDYHFTVLHQLNLPENHPLFYLDKKQLIFLPINIPVIGPLREIAILKMHKALKKYDLYHCTSSYLPAFGITIPAIVTVHDLKYALFPEFFNNRLKIMYYRWVISRGAKRARKIIAISASTKRDLINLGIDEAKISIIHESATIPIELAETECTLPEAVRNRDYFFFVGDNRPHKNIPFIIKAYQRLIEILGEKCPYFVFAGAHYNNSQFSSVKSELKKKLIFLDIVSEKNLVCLYRNAIGLVYPSLYEGFGLPILEAMSLGTPVITSNCSSMPEVAGDAALQIDPHNVDQLIQSMLNLARHISERERLRKLGIERAKQFSWVKAAHKTIQLYNKVLQK